MTHCHMQLQVSFMISADCSGEPLEYVYLFLYDASSECQFIAAYSRQLISGRKVNRIKVLRAGFK